MKFFRFIMVGGSTALVQFSVLALCINELDLSPAIGAGIAYTMSVCFHYFLNRYFTFQLNGKPNVREMTRYLTIVFINGAITVSVTNFSVEKLHFDAYIGTTFSIIVTVFVTFFAAKHWIFTSTKDQYE